MTANNIGLLHRLCLHRHGFAALPVELVAQDVAAGRLIPVIPDWKPPKVAVHALTETKLLPAKVRVFIDFLIARLKPA